MAEAEYTYKDIIIEHHKHGLGASDGNLLSKVANLGYVPTSCEERLAIIKGLYSKDNDIKTEAMALGDLLENEVFDMLHENDNRWQSNYYFESKKYSRENCKLFVHIDFMLKDDEHKILNWVEHKSTKRDIDYTRHEYANQLFIESMLGKEMTQSLGKGWRFNLQLSHYDTTDFDGNFDPEKIELRKVRFGNGFFDINKTMDIISDKISSMTEYYKDEVDADYLPENVKGKFMEVANCVNQINELNQKVKQFKENVYKFMVDKNIKSIKNDYFCVTRVDDTVVPKFDTKEFQKDHKTLYKKYMKNTNRNGYALFKTKN